MKLKILSWNIWCDGHFGAIKQFLESSKADIIGLQEVLPHSKQIPVIELLTSLGYAHVYAPVMTMTLLNGEREELGNAVFSKYPIVSYKTHVLSGEKKRIAVQADIDVAGKILHVFSTHLVHTHQQPSSIQDLQAENLIKILPKERVIVMGDFNATPESPVIKKMRKNILDTELRPVPTLNPSVFDCPHCDKETIAGTRLDYIFVSSDIKAGLPRVGNSKGSDHLPISVAVEV